MASVRLDLFTLKQRMGESRELGLIPFTTRVFGIQNWGWKEDFPLNSITLEFPKPHHVHGKHGLYESMKTDEFGTNIFLDCRTFFDYIRIGDPRGIELLFAQGYDNPLYAPYWEKLVELREEIGYINPYDTLRYEWKILKNAVDRVEQQPTNWRNLAQVYQAYYFICGYVGKKSYQKCLAAYGNRVFQIKKHLRNMEVITINRDARKKKAMALDLLKDVAKETPNYELMKEIKQIENSLYAAYLEEEFGD